MCDTREERREKNEQSLLNGATTTERTFFLLVSRRASYFTTILLFSLLLHYFSPCTRCVFIHCSLHAISLTNATSMRDTAWPRKYTLHALHKGNFSFDACMLLHRLFITWTREREREREKERERESTCGEREHSVTNKCNHVQW